MLAFCIACCYPRMAWLQAAHELALMQQCMACIGVRQQHWQVPLRQGVQTLRMPLLVLPRMGKAVGVVTALCAQRRMAILNRFELFWPWCTYSTCMQEVATCCVHMCGVFGLWITTRQAHAAGQILRAAGNKVTMTEFSQRFSQRGPNAVNFRNVRYLPPICAIGDGQGEANLGTDSAYRDGAWNTPTCAQRASSLL